MMQLTGKRIQSGNASYSKGVGITAAMFVKADNLIAEMLQGNRNLTKKEIGEGLAGRGVAIDPMRLGCYLTNAEMGGIICSGPDKAGKPTFALVEERIPPVREVAKEEALAILARKYFKSHSPATLVDFTWWSGLSLTEARLAIHLISDELIAGQFDLKDFFVHQSCKKTENGDSLHFLPSYDEYLISYKDRATVMDPQHHPRAFNNFGIFYPVIVHRGMVVGNWKKTARKNGIVLHADVFDQRAKIDPQLISRAEQKYRMFLGPA